MVLSWNILVSSHVNHLKSAKLESTFLWASLSEDSIRGCLGEIGTVFPNLKVKEENVYSKKVTNSQYKLVMIATYLNYIQLTRTLTTVKNVAEWNRRIQCGHARATITLLI